MPGEPGKLSCITSVHYTPGSQGKAADLENYAVRVEEGVLMDPAHRNCVLGKGYNGLALSAADAASGRLVGVLLGFIVDTAL